MPSFTKEAILKAFLHIAAKKPIEKITVRDIVDECGINRNTFYYHFQDMYAVLEEICRDAIEGVPRHGTLADAMTGFLKCMSNFALEHPRSMHGLIVSLGYDGLYRYMAPQLKPLILECLERDIPTETREYLGHVTLFICHGVVGLAGDLMKAGAEAALSTVTDDLHRMLTQLTKKQEFVGQNAKND